MPKNSPENSPENFADKSPDGEKASEAAEQPKVKEHGGRDGPDPARYGDWEVGGKCVDF